MTQTIPSPAEDASRLGADLRRRRQQRGLALDDISRRIHVPLQWLQAIENENWEIFPAVAYLEGFLKSYASFLDTDADDAVREYRRSRKTSGSPGFLPPAPLENKEGITPGFPGRLRTVLLALALLVLSALYFYEWEADRKEEAWTPSWKTAPAAESSPPRPAAGAHAFGLVLKGSVWLRVWVDDRIRFEGTLSGAAAKTWSGETLRVQCKDLSLVDITIDGQSMAALDEAAPGEFHWPPKSAAP